MVVDQSQLHGLLDRVGVLGLDLVSVNAVGDEAPPVGPQLDRSGAAGSQPALERAMTEASVSFAGNLTDQPEVRYTQGERRSIVESKVSVPEWGPYARADA
jgi:hypothetical protein